MNLKPAVFQQWDDLPKYYFQEPGSTIAKALFSFHDDLRFFLVWTLFLVVYILYSCLVLFVRPAKTNGFNRTPERLVHAVLFEIIWTITPTLVLILIALPSFAVLYSFGEFFEPFFLLKVIGNQWYWTYEFLDNKTINEFAKNYIPDILDQKFEVSSYPDWHIPCVSSDYCPTLPTKWDVAVHVTSNDVLHSWSVPALGIKIDAAPSRTNESFLSIKYPGFYSGQCTEICGTGHGFRPTGIWAAYSISSPLSIDRDPTRYQIAVRKSRLNAQA